MIPELPGGDPPKRIAGFGGIVVAGFLAAVVVLYAFAWLAREVLERETVALDTAALQFLLRFSSPQLTLAAQIISLMGSEVIFVVALGLFALFSWQRRWGAAFSLLLVTGGAQLLNDVLKALFQRTRPTPLNGLITWQQFSFPSGHAMVAAAFYFYVVYLVWHLVHGWWRGVLVGGLLVLVVLIGVARIYLQVHYLSDVVAGYLAGFVWTDAVVIGSHLLSVRVERRRSVRE